MHLLVITQKIDKDDPILGFFHRWICVFAEQIEKVTVICLEKGSHTLPSNVKVFSLGKESGKSRTKYIWRFFQYIWEERYNYDSVFVHMNQEYVLLGGVIWRLLGKRILFWRNHPHGNFLTRVAVALADKVFCTSPQSFTARFKKTEIMPVGIDTDFFKEDKDILRDDKSILYVGRLSVIKNVHILIQALILLHEQKVEFTATLVGDMSEEKSRYLKNLLKESEKLIDTGKLTFLGKVSNDKLPVIYNKHKTLVNLTPSGSLDKVIFEAMACGVTPLVFNKSLEGILDKELIVQKLTPRTVAQQLDLIIKRDIYPDAGQLREKVVRSHDLKRLIPLILKYA